MARKRKKTDFFQELTWDDLQEWAGSKIVSRGKGYQRSSHVQGLARSPSGGLVAWVEGTERYATRVDFEDGALISACSCPYWDTCKHAVAVVLEYLDHLKKDVKVPRVTEQDRRMRLLEEFSEEEAWDEEDGEDMENVVRLAPQQSGKAAGKSIQAFLKQQTKAQLIALVEDLAERYPVVRETLQDQQDLSKGTVKRMVNTLKKEIRELSSKPGWRNYWNDEGYTPDYSRVKDRLETLLARGHADEVVALGTEVLNAGTRQVGMSDDEGETSYEISSCLDVVFQALPQSSLPPAEQMLWAVEAALEDQYDLCLGAERFWKRKHKVADWRALADNLMKRLKHFETVKGEESFSRQYRRDRLSDWVVHALENAGRHEEIIPLCKQKAEKTGSCVRLVNFLKKAKRWEEAEEWIHKGIKSTRKQWPGIANTLRTALREMREKEGDWPRVAAMRAEDFFREPTLNTFKELEKAAKRAKVWPAVRAAAMRYLEAGKLPRKNSSWPLPETGVIETVGRRQVQFPLTEALIDIAIAEKHPDDVIRWYDQRKTKGIGIWKGLAEGQIALTKPKAYREAAAHLRKVRHLLKKLGKEKEWREYLAEIRQVNVRKRRLLEILDGLDGRPIVHGL